MKEIVREYRASDYEQCEALVNLAWGFDKIFSPQKLSDLVKLIYTKGSVLGSNDRLVVEVDGQVVGFLFGLNEYSKKPGRNILFGLSVLWKLLRIRNGKPQNSDLLNAIKAHETNRSAVVDRGRSEIVLFVIAEEYQGKGFGQQLWSEFKSHCIQSGVSSIIVETNKLG
ncbi:MAG: GNAT family N-acetyltransferase, partial [Pseudomonadota bacterium]|nr:GNAT family N-acetyltransferase [Pseudomonadota bacterium]